MAAATPVNESRAPSRGAVLGVRLGVALAILAVWEAISRSGLFFGDVVPSTWKIVASFGKLATFEGFWTNVGVTAGEVVASVAIGSVAGVAFGIAIGAEPFLRRAYEPILNYLSPTPRIILFPVMIMWFGIGPESKVALGALSAFFPVALSTAAGMALIDPVLIRVGRSFRATRWQMAMKIYLPAMRAPVLNGVRLGFGLAIIGVLLAETKLSNKGLGFLVMQFYTRFDMPTLYALLIVLFAMAGIFNALIGRLAKVGL